MNIGEDRITTAAQQFAHDGVVVLRGVLDAAWLQHLSAALDEALATPTPLAQNFAGTQGGAFRSDLYLSSAFASFREFAMRSPVGELGARMLGVEHVTLFTDELLVKEPGTPQETPWHHDMPYWPIGGDSAEAKETVALSKVDGHWRLDRVLALDRERRAAITGVEALKAEIIAGRIAVPSSR